jgi:hypothetical protein
VPIVSSFVKEDSAQADGRRWIREHHLDQVGVLHERVYMALASHVVDLNASVPMLNQQLKDHEIQVNLGRIFVAGDLATITSVHITIQEFGVGAREAYRQATREQSYALGAFLDTLTNQQLANMFGYGNPSVQLMNLRSNVATKRTQWHEYLAAGGE